MTNNKIAKRWMKWNNKIKNEVVKWLSLNGWKTNNKATNRPVIEAIYKSHLMCVCLFNPVNWCFISTTWFWQGRQQMPFIPIDWQQIPEGLIF